MGNIDSVKVCFAAVTAVCLCVIVKQWKSDLLPLVRLAATVLFAGAILSVAAPLVSFLREMTDRTGIPTYAAVLLKALGIAVLTQCAADICRDAGENGIAGGVELAGKAEILLLCLPLAGEIFGVANRLFDLV